MGVTFTQKLVEIYLLDPLNCHYKLYKVLAFTFALLPDEPRPLIHNTLL